MDTWGNGLVSLLVDLVARFQTPHTNSVVVTCRHDVRTVGVDTEARDAALVTHKHHLQTPVEVPHFDCKDTHKQLHAEAILFTERASLTCSILSAGYEIFEWIEKQKGGNIARVKVRLTLQHLAFEQVEHLQNKALITAWNVVRIAWLKCALTTTVERQEANALCDRLMVSSRHKYLKWSRSLNPATDVFRGSKWRPP